MSGSYGRAVGLFKEIGDMGYHTYSTLYYSHIVPVANYAAAVYGFQDYLATRVLKNRITKFHIGIHRFAPVASTQTEMNFLTQGSYTCQVKALWQLVEDKWFEEFETKLMLCCYTEFRLVEDQRALAVSNLKRYQRSILDKLMFRILPL